MRQPTSSRAGIIPGGMEMMDRPAIHAVEEFVHAGYPLDVEALLIVELDGPQAEVDHLIERVDDDRHAQCGAVTCRVSTIGGGAAAVLGRPQGGVSGGRAHLARLSTAWTAPSRARELPAGAQAHARAVATHYGLRVANVFHAGDGNLHPLILYDANKPGELERAEQFGADILRLCVEVGGVLTGEHGVGVEKRDLMPEMFSETDLNAAAAPQMRLRRQGPAQSRQGVSDPAPLRRARPHARARAARCRFRTCRGSESCSMTHAETARCQGGRGRRAVGAGREQAARSRRPRHPSAAIGRPVQTDVTLDLSGLSGVTLYEPEELVLSARAGTPIAEIEALVAAKRPGAGIRADGLRRGYSAAAGARHARRRAGRATVGPAPHQGGRGARSFPRLHRPSPAAARPSRRAAGW